MDTGFRYHHSRAVIVASDKKVADGKDIYECTCEGLKPLTDYVVRCIAYRYNGDAPEVTAAVSTFGRMLEFLPSRNAVIILS